MKNILLKILIVIVFFCLCLHGKYYYTENLLGMLILSSFIGFYFFKINKFLGAFVGYVLFHSIYIIFNMPFKFNSMGANWGNYFNKIISNGLVWFLVFLFGIFLLSKENFKKVFSILPYLCFLNSLVCIYSYFASNGQDLKGIIGASSIDSALTACLIPIFWENIKHHNNYLKYFLLSIVVISVILMKGSVGVACLLIVLFFMFIKHLKKIIPFLILILIASFYLTNPNTFFSGSGRFEMYKDSFDYWFKNENIFFGTGIATYWAFGPLVQLAYKTINRGDYFTHMHSDILQFIFEFGFVGGLILLFLVVDFIKRIYKKIFLLSAFFAFCCFSMFYYPMHEFLTAFVGILIYREGLENGREQISND